MSSIDLIRMGLKNLFRRKTRTFLTILGVIIGTASIVSMLSLGFGMKESFQNQISSMGSVTTIDVYQSYGGGSMKPSMSQSTGALDEKAIARFKQIEGVQAVTPLIESYVKIVSGKYAADVPIRGIVPETMGLFDYKVKEGRLLNSGEELAIVFGGQMIYNFRDSKSSGRFSYYGMPGKDQKPKVNVLTDKLQLTFDMSYGMRMPPGVQNTSKPAKLHKIKCVGIMEEGQRDSDYAVYMDIGQLKKLIQDNMKNSGGQNSMNRNSMSEQLKYQRIMIKVEDMKYVKGAQEKIKEMGFEAHSLNDILDSMQKTSSTIQLVLGGIGAVSLLVAALGITNTMIMSIYERTREIGIMKVIGASLKDIKNLFLFESGMIGLMGGVFGIGISFALSYFLNNISRNFGMFMGPGGPESKISIIPLWLVISVMGFTTIVGLVSGYYPARRAMKLSALEAIKNE